MKLRKIFAALAAATVTALCTVPVYAVGDGEATYCFDNGTTLGDWVFYGSADETGFTLSQSTGGESKNGNGCLTVSVDVKSDNITQQYGGVYIEASTLGLVDFRGCTVEMSVKLCEGAEGFYDNFSLYTDGIIWLTSSPGTLSTSEWTTVTLTVPADAANTKVGFTIPTYLMHKGDILYIDDFTVTDIGGEILPNRGDYVLREVKTTETTSTVKNIALTVVLVLLIIVIIGGIGVIVSMAIKKFS